MSSFEKAVAALADRTTAVAGEKDVVSANPDTIVREFLSGYLPLEDIDHAIEFVSQCADATRSNWLQTPSAAGRKAMLMGLFAQMLLVGAATEREVWHAYEEELDDE